MKLMMVHLLGAAGMLISGVCFAGQQTGLITQMHIRSSDGLVYFHLDGAPSGKPACAIYHYWIIKDENSNAGKQQIAALLMAKASGKAITVTGRNACTRWGDGEDVDDIQLNAN
jgi:hypothetical protein